MGIIAEKDLFVRSTYHRIKDDIPGQLVFGLDRIIPIKHITDWRYILQRKKSQIEKYAIRKKPNQIEYNHRVGYQVLLVYKAAHKYRTPFKVPYNIVQTRKNGTVTSRMGTVTLRVNSRRINP